MSNKPIFIHIPKTGGKSIQSALADNIQTIGHHKTAAQIKSSIDYWNDVYTFSIIRNPWDRMVSTYHFKLKKRDKKVIDRSFNEWILDVLCKEKPSTQCDYLMKDGKIIVDFVARFENFSSDFKKICSKIGVQKKLLHKNSTDHKKYVHYYSNKSKDAVGELFKDEIEKFGYGYDAIK